MSKQNITLTVDMVVQYKNMVLLIRRAAEPFRECWALPGGFVNDDELLKDAAARELKEETSLDQGEYSSEFIGYFDDPQRDPRGRMISMAFGIKLKEKATVRAGDDAGEARWWDLDNLPKLGFDHQKIIKYWKELSTQP